VVEGTFLVSVASPCGSVLVSLLYSRKECKYDALVGKNKDIRTSTYRAGQYQSREREKRGFTTRPPSTIVDSLNNLCTWHRFPFSIRNHTAFSCRPQSTS